MLGTRQLRYDSSTRGLRRGVVPFFAPWYNGRRVFWRVRIAAWLVCAAGATALDWRLAAVGPVAFEMVFFCLVLAGYLRHRAQVRRQLAALHRSE